jgi:sugar lactone lactonase YvrE
VKSAQAHFDVVASDVYFPESPRWHDGALWFSDMYGRGLHRYADSVQSTVTFMVDANPSGLGWLPDGRLLVVAMQTQAVMTLGPDGALVEHCDLQNVARGMPNDMVVAQGGFAFVGDGGYSPTGDFRTVARLVGQLLLVRGDGSVTVAADDLVAPNGIAVDPEMTTLIVAETQASRLTAFKVDSEGRLSGRRVFAVLPPPSNSLVAPRPDGLCLDVDGAVWIADPAGQRVLRMREGGDMVEAYGWAEGVPVACVLGGPDRRTLFVCTVPDMNAERIRSEPAGRVVAAAVQVAGAGTP